MRNIRNVFKVLPLPVKTQMISLFSRKKLNVNSKKQAFIFLAADYGNIGDIAISTAQKRYLKNELKDFEVVSVPISQTRQVLRSIKKQIKKEDLVTIIGGGNMGASYPDIEALRQLIIKSFPNNRLICFPQTLDWNQSRNAKRALRKIVKVYARHPDIHVFARESITYTKLSELFAQHNNVNVNLVPDIVMTATGKALGGNACTVPSGILSCLRDDKEAAMSMAQYDFLAKVLADTGYSIQTTDTHAGGSQLTEQHCAALLADKLSQFCSAKLVVTDRLHGMILSLLSGTPCLVVPNTNHKISQTWYDWLQDHPRLIFVEQAQFDKIPQFIETLLSEPRGTPSETPLSIKQYDKLKEVLMR